MFSILRSFAYFFIMTFTQAAPVVFLPHAGEVIEGDVVVSENLIQYAKETTNRKREYHSSTLLWNMNDEEVKIPYKIVGLNESMRNPILQAIEAYKALTCIKFVPQSTEKDYVVFRNGGVTLGCSSQIGRQGGVQFINVVTACNSLATILHEMMHSIGFLHEQTREDRDDFVSVIYENIRPGFENQFQKYSVQNFGLDYDMRSLMHYHKTAFTSNGHNTIESKSDTNQALGNKEFFTKIDLNQVNTLYNCPAKYLQLNDWVITIFTSGEWWAGTGATVYMEVEGDGLDSSGEFKAGKGFEKNSHVNIEKFFPSISMKKLLIRHDNTGLWPGWHLDKIVISDITSGIVTIFHCNCWIEDSAKTIYPS